MHNFDRKTGLNLPTWQLPYPLANCPRKLDKVYNTGDQMPYLLDPSERLTGWTVLVGDFFVQQAALPR